MPSDSIEPLGPAAVERLERAATKAAAEQGGVGDLLGVIEGNVETAIRDKKAERSALAARVLALSEQIAQLETHQLLNHRVPPPPAG